MIAIAFLTGSCPKADTNGVFSDNDAWGHKNKPAWLGSESVFNGLSFDS
jgi:hypothetical protein